MLIEQPAVRERLSKLVHSITADCGLYDDLSQEALIHVWQQESQCPGQTPAWYMQSCYFHLLDYLGRGHSLDSLKHRRNRCPLAQALQCLETFEDERVTVESGFDSVSAHDILHCLAQRVNSTDKSMLDYLAVGLGVREIGLKLHLSHQAVAKHRRRIAALALQLDIAPLPARTRH